MIIPLKFKEQQLSCNQSPPSHVSRPRDIFLHIVALHSCCATHSSHRDLCNLESANVGLPVISSQGGTPGSVSSSLYAAAGKMVRWTLCIPSGCLYGVFSRALCCIYPTCLPSVLFSFFILVSVPFSVTLRPPCFQRLSLSLPFWQSLLRSRPSNLSTSNVFLNKSIGDQSMDSFVLLGGGTGYSGGTSCGAGLVCSSINACEYTLRTSQSGLIESQITINALAEQRPQPRHLEQPSALLHQPQPRRGQP